MASGLLSSWTKGSEFSGVVVPGGINQDKANSGSPLPSVTLTSAGQVSLEISKPGREKERKTCLKVHFTENVWGCRNSELKHF